jgi:uncharacterized protein (DUF58 family)
MLPKFLAERLSKPAIVRRTLDHFVFVPRHQTVEHRVIHIFDRRGRFIIRDFEISSRFPFGFFRHRRRLPAREAELFVFPKLEPFDHTLDAQQIELGRQTANKRGLGQDLLALRDYQPNDDLRRIDWKATARSRNLTVREFSADDDKRVIVVFDNRLLEDEATAHTLREKLDAEQSGQPIVLSDRFERGVSLAASLLAHFNEEQAEVCLVIGKENGDFGLGSRHLYNSLKRLAMVGPDFSLDREPYQPGERILNESDGVYRFVISCNDSVKWPSEPTRQLKIIRF